MTAPLSSFRISIPDGVLVRELGEGCVLLNLDSESYFGLDEIGTRMWIALTTCPSAEAALQQVLAEYDVAPEALRADLFELVDKLAGAKLIRVDAL